MDPYVCSEFEIPDTLYRVDYPGSQTVFSSTSGFTSADTTKVFPAHELDEFKQAIVNQFTWSSRASSPFISLFSDREHAENWGCKEPWRGHKDKKGDWSLCAIDTTVLKDTGRFFKISDLVEELGLKIPGPAGQHVRGAFVCLHRIPAEAVIERTSAKEVEEDRQDRREALYCEKIDMDYLGEYSGSEREAMQENYNTIFEENMENNW
ncbi:hypothetical protein BCR34DRAFT_629189 [Clohesyomyces aquaticus]|uniref:DUF7587 domain-containing protein n=1 Tax=Clohesyomyces aquaticus TaxID=1231657 RepID=A0A1Y1Y8X6_9PLEO|nr:hypothetical protein BCR34DRAFT_629189 [Clohesyomyces aquaticus]